MIFFGLRGLTNNKKSSNTQASKGPALAPACTRVVLEGPKVGLGRSWCMHSGEAVARPWLAGAARLGGGGQHTVPRRAKAPPGLHNACQCVDHAWRGHGGSGSRRRRPRCKGVAPARPGGGDATHKVRLWRGCARSRARAPDLPWSLRGLAEQARRGDAR